MVEVTLEATQILLAEIGYEQTNTTRIAERAGISVGSLYQYFSGRDEIIGELQRRHHNETSSILEAAFAEAEGMPIESAVRRLVQATADLHRHEPELHRVLTEIVPQSVNRESRVEGNAKIDAAQERWFKSMAAQIGLKDPTISSLVIREAVEGSIHSAAIHGDPSHLDAVVEELSVMIIAYLNSRRTV